MYRKSPVGLLMNKKHCGGERHLGHSTHSLDLGNGVAMELVKIPAGRFVMGDPAGERDELPPHVVTIDKPFWIGRCEVTNQQYALFDSGPRQPIRAPHFVDLQ